MKLLLISDDENYKRELMRNLSEKFETVFIDAKTKKEFRKGMEEADAIITDYEIRWGSGINVLLEAKKANPFIPVIMLINRGMEEVAAEAMRFGLDDYVYKGDRIKIISSLKAAMERERERERQAMLSLVVENAREAVVGVNENGIIIYANKATEEIFGWKSHELIGKHMSVMAFDKKEQEMQWKKAIKAGRLTIEAVRKDKYGNEVPVLMTVIPVKGKGGKILLSFAIMVDMRKAKEHERRIEHLNELLMAIRTINQIITREKDIDNLLKECCYMLGKVKKYDMICLIYGRKVYRHGNEKIYRKAAKIFREKEGEVNIDGKYVFITSIDKKGKLCVISPNKFDAQEIELLKEVSSDVSFAIDSIKVEKEKERIQKKLEESQKKYKMLVEKANEGICIDDANERIVFVNRAYARALGYKRKEIIGKDFTSLIYDEDKEKFRKEMEKRRKGKASKYELRVVAKDGRIKTFLISAIPLYENGKFAGSLSINLDITEQKELERKFEAVFEGAMDAIFIEELNGDIIDVNGAACKLLGYTKEEFRKMNVADILPPEFREKIGKIMDEHLKKGGIRMEAINIHKNGSHIPVDVSTTMVEIEGKKRVVAIVRDISQRKKMEEEIKESEERYRLLAENLPLGVFMAIEEEIIYVNRYGREKLMKGMFPSIYSKFKTKGKVNLQEVIKKIGIGKEVIEKVKKGEEVYQEISSGGKYIEIKLMPFKYKKKDAILGIANDITELKKNIEYLERFHDATIDRELKMIELKKKLKEYEEKLKWKKG